MAEMAMPFEATKPLSAIERVADTFVAPSKTFTDLRRSAGWWLPCILILLTSAIYSFTAIRKVGMDRMTDTVIATMPKLQDMIANAKPDEAALIRSKIEGNLRNQFYTAPVILLIAGFVTAGLFLLTANFAFGGQATYKGMLALFWYSILPLVLMSLLIALLLALGVNTENFRIANPIGTNPGYYLQDGGSSPVLLAALSFIDLFSIWIFCLQAIGTSILARISLGKAVISVAIWWVLYSLLKIVPAMMYS